MASHGWLCSGHRQTARVGALWRPDQQRRTSGVSRQDDNLRGLKAVREVFGLWTSRSFYGQLRWPLQLIWTVLESSWDSEQDDTKFAKFRRWKTWYVVLCKCYFKPWSEPNEALFWGNNLESIFVAKNDSIWYILPMFGFVCKMLHFSRQL